MSALTGTRQVVADRLFAEGAIKFGEFKMKLHETQPNAPLSPVYLNLRTARHPKNPGPVTDETMELVSELFEEKLDELHGFECFADIPDAGEPFGDAFEAATTRRRMSATRLRMTKLMLGDGTRRIDDNITGEWSTGWVAVVVDEMITQADTKLEAIHALEANGLVVKDVVLLADRGQGGDEQLARAGYTLHSVFTLEELLDHYVSTGQLEQEKADEVKAYLKANTKA